MRSTKIRTGLGAAAVLLGAGFAHADVIAITGNLSAATSQTGADFIGSINWTATGSGTGTLVVSLTNTTPAPVGGFLTGFVFNINSLDANAAANLTPSPTANFLNTGPESGSPFGNFMAGAALGGNWTGGGSPNGGIPVGGSAQFTFAVTASDAGSLSASSFMSGPNQHNFVVRFKGLANDGSDKVPGGVIPTPGSMALFAAGLGFMARRRKR